MEWIVVHYAIGVINQIVLLEPVEVKRQKTINLVDQLEKRIKHECKGVSDHTVLAVCTVQRCPNILTEGPH